MKISRQLVVSCSIARGDGAALPGVCSPQMLQGRRLVSISFVNGWTESEGYRVSVWGGRVAEDSDGDTQVGFWEEAGQDVIVAERTRVSQAC